MLAAVVRLMEIRPETVECTGRAVPFVRRRNGTSRCCCATNLRNKYQDRLKLACGRVIGRIIRVLLVRASNLKTKRRTKTNIDVTVSPSRD